MNCEYPSVEAVPRIRRRNSLQATQVVSRLRENLRVDVPLSAVFENPTVADLAAVVADRAEPAPQSTAEVPESTTDTDALAGLDVSQMGEDEMDRLLATLLGGDDE